MANRHTARRAFGGIDYSCSLLLIREEALLSKETYHIHAMSCERNRNMPSTCKWTNLRVHWRLGPALSAFLLCSFLLKTSMYFGSTFFPCVCLSFTLKRRSQKWSRGPQRGHTVSTQQPVHPQLRILLPKPPPSCSIQNFMLCSPCFFCPLPALGCLLLNS